MWATRKGHPRTGRPCAKGADDFGPLVRSPLASAKEFGMGVLPHIETKDAEFVFSLK